MKWVPAIHWLIRPATKRWGLLWLAVSVALSLALLPLTILQFQALFGFGARPVRLDYLVYLWAFVPWLYRRAGTRDLAKAATWRALAAETMTNARSGPSRKPVPG